MKPTLGFVILISSCCVLVAQPVQKPDWVKLFQQGQSLPDAMDVYFGIGSSTTKQEDADGKARQEFGLHVEVRVESAITREIHETDKALNDEYTLSAKIVSDVMLRGISITERFEDKDEKKFYAIIKIQKSTYDTLLVTEIRRDLERKKAENKVREDKRAEELRSLQADLELKRKEEEIKKQEFELQKKHYEDFLKLKVPDEVVDLRNGEIGRSLLTLAAKMSLSPLDLQSAYWILGLKRIEISANTYFVPSKLSTSKILEREQAAVKVQMLDQAGEFYRLSLAFGFLGYANVSSLRAFDSVKPKYSFLLATNITLPNALYSYASAYLDGRKISVGLTNYPFPGHFKDAVSLLLQVDYIWSKEWRNRFLDPLMIQSGIRFRASDSFITSFTYENHEYIVFTIEIGL